MSDLGERIKLIRESANMSIDDLAEKTNLISLQIEALEQSNVLPSLSILTRVCRALNISQSILLDGTEDESITITRKNERRTGPNFSIGASSQVSAASTMIFYPLAATKTNRIMEPYSINIKKGDEASMRTSSHEGEEFMYVTKGEITLKYGAETYTLKEGDSVYYDSIVPHSFKSDTETSEIVVVIYIPA